jgi:CDP-paratose 2-epimerase
VVYLRRVKCLVTGGAGFVGSTLALLLQRDVAGIDVTAFDNLRRRGSELALDRLRAGGVTFRHGDVRSADDLSDAGPFDILIECSAEPSVHAGYDGSPAYVLDTNLTGAARCLDAARRYDASVVFLSTSRVYSIPALVSLPLERQGDRLELHAGASGPGWSARGIIESFPTSGPRSLYGTSKLAAELLVEEYHAMYGLRTVVNRCGLIAGPWQMGKADQGLIAFWAARHEYGGELSYTGFGGEGLQVRDVLHVVDLYDLVRVQLSNLTRLSGQVYNVGGGPANSVSLVELTEKCRQRTGRTIGMGRVHDTREFDIPYYVTDNARVSAATGWAPSRGVDIVLDDVFSWLRAHRAALEHVVAPAGHAQQPAPAGGTRQGA